MTTIEPKNMDALNELKGKDKKEILGLYIDKRQGKSIKRSKNAVIYYNAGNDSINKISTAEETIRYKDNKYTVYIGDDIVYSGIFEVRQNASNGYLEEDAEITIKHNKRNNKYIMKKEYIEELCPDKYKDIILRKGIHCTKEEYETIVRTLNITGTINIYDDRVLLNKKIYDVDLDYIEIASPTAAINIKDMKVVYGVVSRNLSRMLSGVKKKNKWGDDDLISAVYGITLYFAKHTITKKMNVCLVTNYYDRKYKRKSEIVSEYKSLGELYKHIRKYIIFEKH